MFVHHALSRIALLLPVQQLLARLVWLLAVALTTALTAQAQPIVTDYAAANVSTAALKLVEIAVLRDVSPKLSLPDILAGQGGAFVPQENLSLKDESWSDTHLWLRLSLQGVVLPAGQTAPAIYLLEFPKPFLDDIRLYSPPLADGQAWRVQAAGDFIAQKDWVFRGLHPRFLLPRAQDLLAMPEGKQVLYVRISHIAPMTVQAQINSAGRSSEIAQSSFLGLGLALGAMFFTAVLSLSLALLNKDSLFAWYGAYVVASALANASYSGLAHLLLWPVSGYWPNTAIMFWLLLATGLQLQFCRVLFQSHSASALPPRAAIALGMLCTIAAVLYALMPEQWMLFYYLGFALTVTSIILIVPMVGWVWRQGNRLALVWLIAFIPLFCILIWGLFDGIGMFQSVASYNLPIYAAALEVILFGLALQWFARERHGELERSKALATVDPLTGFATAEAFQIRLRRDWHGQDMQKHDLAVAYIELKTKASSNQQLEMLLMRSVRILRSATRAQDMVARLDGQLLAVVMPKVSMGDDLNQVLSRIVALGLIPDRGDTTANILQFRIAATTRLHFKDALAQLDAQLRDLLVQPSGWGSRPIRMIDHLARQSAPRAASLHHEDLEDIWEQAMTSEMKMATTAPQSTLTQ